MGIAIPGLGSGLDVNSMISSLMAAEQKPQDQLKTQQSANSVVANAWTSLGTIVTALQSSAAAIQTPDLVPSVTASTSQPGLVSVTSSSSALPGSVTFRVNRLATAQQLATSGLSATDVVGASTTVITAGDAAVGATTVTAGANAVTGHHTVQITGSASSPVALVDGSAVAIQHDADPASTHEWLTMADGTTVDFAGGATVGTLSIGIAKTGASATTSDLATALATAGGPARAALVDTGDGSSTPARLVLTAGATGSVGALTVTSTVAALSSTTELAPAQDAELVVGTSGGSTMLVHKSTNTVTDLLGGATINLTAASTTQDVTVTIAQDTAATTQKVQSLVSSLNDTLNWISTNTAWDSTKNTGGPMMGQSGVRDVNDALVRAMQSQPTTGSYHSLADLGIKMQQDGSYTVDATALQTALTKDPDSFARYVSTLASAVSTAATAATGTNGSITLGKAAAASTDKSLQDAIDGWTSRLSDIQTRYEKMFSDLDVAMSQLKSQQSQLTSALASLPSSSG